MVPLPVIISGLAMGCIYALVALGYVFIWNSMAIINFAQGEFLMFAAFVYVATFSMRLGLGFVPSVVLTAAAMGLMADFKFESNGDGNHQIHMVEDRKGEARWVSTVKF